MSSLSTEKVNTKLEAYKLVHDPTRLLCLLYSKYGDIEEDYYLSYTNQIFYNVSSHLNIIYKENQYIDNFEEFLKRFYRKRESIERVPKLSDYYKNYLKFFCRPFFKNYKLAKLLHDYEDKKAEIFYKNNYADSVNDADEKEKDNSDKKSTSSLSSLDNITNNKIIFDKRTKKIIDNDLNNDLCTLTLTLDSAGTNLIKDNNNNLYNGCLISKRSGANSSFEKNIYTLVHYKIKKKNEKKNKKKSFLNNIPIQNDLNIIKEENEENVIKENEEEEEENLIQSENVENLIKNENYQTHKKIIQIITDYFNSLTKYIKIMHDYFNLNSNPAYSSYLILWYKQEFLSMNKQIEHLFSRVKTIHELQAIMNFLTILFTQLDEQGNSSKFIYDQYFINNLKITLESIVNFCMKNEIVGVSFDLKKYEINFNNKKIIFHCVFELGSSIFNISMILIEFLTKFITIKKKFIGIVFLEEFLFENILLKDFLDFIKTKIEKNISNNYDVKPFGDTNESIASSNQILINYGITIISIEKLFKFFLKEIENNNEINQTSKKSFLYLIKQINEEKISYFSNLLKVKIESHFYKFFDSQKDLLTKNSNENNNKIERAFLIFIYLIKNLTKMLKNRINDENEIKNEIINFFIFDSQYVNFLNIIGNIKNLNEFYDTDFNLSQIGSNGIEIIINGIWFVYYCCLNLLNLNNEKKFKNVTENFIEEILKNWSEIKNVSIDKYLKNNNSYQSNIINYINENKNEIFKGFNFD